MVPNCLRAALVLVVLVSACGGGEGSEPPGDRRAAGEGRGLATIADALASVPAAGSEEVDELVWGDLEKAAGIAGVEAPDDPADRDAVGAYVDALQGFPVDREVYPLLPEAANPRSGSLGLPVFADELGWSLLDVDQFVERRTSADSVAVFEGDFDRAELSEALGEPEDGAWVVAEPPSQVQLEGPLSLRLDGPTLSVGRDGGSADAIGDLATGGSPSLADGPDLVALADALDQHDPYAAMLAWPGPRFEPLPAGTPCGAALPQPPAAVGVAITDDDAGSLVLVALAHTSGDAASANAEALPEIVASGSDGLSTYPLRDLYAVDGVDTTGDVVVARLRPSPDPSLGAAAAWWDLLVGPSPLVSSC